VGGIIPLRRARSSRFGGRLGSESAAKDNAKIQDWNYEATKLAIARAVKGEPKIAEVIAQEDVMQHPLAAHV
jgi:5,6,7,8-tetrahydromethanopterin hydro-lyase